MFDAIVLAGGTAARLGGIDKPGLMLGELSLLDRVLTAVAEATRTVVVGPRRPLRHPAPVIWCREQSAGGGPVAALAAGLAHIEADILVLLAADLPSITPAVPVLLSALAGSPADGAVLLDGAGRRNYLAAAWRRASLVRAVAALAAPAGAAMRELVSGAALVDVPDRGRWGLDCDTWADVADARARLAQDGCTRSHRHPAD